MKNWKRVDGSTWIHTSGVRVVREDQPRDHEDFPYRIHLPQGGSVVRELGCGWYWGTLTRAVDAVEWGLRRAGRAA